MWMGIGRALCDFGKASYIRSAYSRTPTLAIENESPSRSRSRYDTNGLLATDGRQSWSAGSAEVPSAYVERNEFVKGIAALSRRRPNKRHPTEREVMVKFGCARSIGISAIQIDHSDSSKSERYILTKGEQSHYHPEWISMAALFSRSSRLSYCFHRSGVHIFHMPSPLMQ
jgi:hypothetical protein